MSIRAVAKKDLTNVRRSRALWAAATVFALGTAMLAYWWEGYRLTPTEAVQQLFGMIAMGLGVLLPLVALVASYLAIAGERRSGGIKFLLGFPNTRRDVFLGKLGSRLLLVAGGLTFAFAAGISVAAAKYGVLPVVTVLGLFLVSLLYAWVFVCIAVALSGAVTARSRAIAAAVGSYLVLVILYVAPGIRITAIARWLHQELLGLESHPELYAAVTYTSPYIAYRKATNLVLPNEMESTVFRLPPEGASDLPVYLSDEFSLVVFAAWLIVPLVLGYLRFDRADLE